jgi:hypothetical protein
MVQNFRNQSHSFNKLGANTSHIPYSCRPFKRQGSSGQTSLVTVYYQRIYCKLTRILDYMSSHALHAAAQDSIMYVRLRKCKGERNRVPAGLLTGRTWPHTLIMLSQDLPASYATVCRESSFILP